MPVVKPHDQPNTQYTLDNILNSILYTASMDRFVSTLNLRNHTHTIPNRSRRQLHKWAGGGSSSKKCWRQQQQHRQSNRSFTLQFFKQ